MPVVSSQLAGRGFPRSLLLLVAFAVFLPQTGLPQSPTGTLYTAVWPGEILALDEATGAIKHKIPFKLGQTIFMTLSPDRKRFYANTAQMEGIEVIDIESRQVINAFKLSEGNRKVRVIPNFAPHPDGSRVFAVVRVAVQEIDRYTLEEPQLVTIDLGEQKITKSLELGPEHSAPFRIMRVSPDGKYLYYFLGNILVIDVEQFEIVDEIEMDRPLYPGAGSVELGRPIEVYDDPETLMFTFNSPDSTTDQDIMGIARFNLLDRSLDVFETNPSPGVSFGVSFAVSPNRKRAYMVRDAVDQYEFYVWDLEGRRFLKKQEYEGRPRTSVKVSSDGTTLLLHTAGNTIDYYDAETLVFEKRVELPGDAGFELFVIPATRDN